MAARELRPARGAGVQASLLDYADLLARQDGVVLGCGFAALFHGLPNSPRVMITVPPGHRGRGAGTALYSAISDWARERELETLEAVLADNDPDSLAFAERRGFVRERHEKGVALDLTAIEPPPSSRRRVSRSSPGPTGPSSRAACSRSRSTTSPDVPGYEDEQHEPFEAWLGARHAGPWRPAGGDLRRGRGRRGGRLREVLPFQHGADARPPRPDRGQARLARPRDRPRAEVRADRLGEGERLRAAADDERRAQHADAPAERAARLPAVRSDVSSCAARWRDRDDRDRAARAGLALAGAGRRRSSTARRDDLELRGPGRLAATSTTGASSPSGSGRWATSRPAGRWLVRGDCPR